MTAGQASVEELHLADAVENRVLPHIAKLKEYSFLSEFPDTCAVEDTLFEVFDMSTTSLPDVICRACGSTGRREIWTTKSTTRRKRTQG